MGGPSASTGNEGEEVDAEEGVRTLAQNRRARSRNTDRKKTKAMEPPQIGHARGEKVRGQAME